VLQHDRTHAAVILMHYYNACFKIGRLSPHARETLLAQLYKGVGDTRDLPRHRPVSLKSVLYQPGAGVINERIKRYTPSAVPRAQCGFIYHRYMTSVLNRLFDTLDEADRQGLLAILHHSTDRDKAFDRSHRSVLWRVLCHMCGYPATFQECYWPRWRQEHQLHTDRERAAREPVDAFGAQFPRLVQWIIMLMRDHWCAAILNEELTRRWLILSGVYQGCRKAPTEYGGVMSLEQHIVAASEEIVGYYVPQQHGQRQALNFLYADDCSKVLWDTRTCVDTALDLEVVWSAGTGGKHSEEKQRTSGRGVLARRPEYRHPIAIGDTARTVWTDRIKVLGAEARTLWRYWNRSRPTAGRGRTLFALSELPARSGANPSGGSNGQQRARATTAGWDRHGASTF
jgi:hypothetical protein